MLTKLYYYKYYKKYIVSEVIGELVVRKKKISLANQFYLAVEKKFVLNKSHSLRLVEYSQNVAGSVLQLKESLRKILFDINKYRSSNYDKKIDAAKEWICQDLIYFSDTYNSACDFLCLQVHSTELKKFAADIKQLIAANENTINTLGLFLEHPGRLVFRQDVFNMISGKELRKAVDSCIIVFEILYKKSFDMLQRPMSDFLNFKNLDYYYSYRIDGSDNNMFSTEDLGMLMDRAV